MGSNTLIQLASDRPYLFEDVTQTVMRINHEM